jgi:glycosyltransferase involved in cell wall biosynthesis
MRACMLAYSRFENDARVRRVTQYLAEEGNEVDVLNLSDGYEVPNKYTKIKIYKLQHRDKNEKSQTDYFRKLLKFFFKSLVRISANHLRKPYDVVHVHSLPDFLVFAAVIPKLLGGKVILDIHDLVPEFYAQKFGVGKKTVTVKILKVLQILSMKFADHVIVANHLWKEDLISGGLNSGKCTVILNSPDPRIFRKRTGGANHFKNAQIRIVYHGTLSELHGLDVAIRAMSRVRETIPQAALIIYGAGHEKENLLRLVKELNLENNVEFFDPLPIESIAERIRECDIGVVPKREGIFSSRAFSTKILEYFAVGIPVIASRTEIDRFYFDDTNISFFNPEDPEDLAAKILELIANPEERTRLIEGSSRFLDNHSWGAYKDEYFKIFTN